MSFDDLNKIWDSPENQPSPEELEQAKAQFAASLKRRHRGFVRYMATVGTVLVVITVVFILELIWPDPEGIIDFAKEWSVIPLFLLPWAALAFSVRHYRRHRDRHTDYETSIQASLQAALDENRISRKRHVFIGGLQIVFLLLLPLVVHQLKTVGKAGDEINAMFVLFPLIFGCIMLGMLWNYRRSLLPGKQKLESLLDAYKSDSRTK